MGGMVEGKRMVELCCGGYGVAKFVDGWMEEWQSGIVSTVAIRVWERFRLG